MTTTCKTKTAILFLACRDRRNLWRFPTDDPERLCAGFMVEVDHATPVYKLLLDHAANVLKITDAPMDAMHISHQIEPLLQMPNGEESTLFIGQLTAASFTVPETWPTLPEILRKMARNKNRIAYLKALQVLAGSADDELHAVEVNLPRQD